MLFLLSWASTRNCFCPTWKHSFHTEYPLERKLTPLIRSLNIFISPLHFKRFVPFSYVLHVCMLVWGREGDRYGSNSTEPRASMPKGTTTFTPSFTGSHHLGWHCHCQWEDVSVFLRKKRRKATAELHALGKLLASSHIWRDWDKTWKCAPWGVSLGIIVIINDQSKPQEASSELGT